MVNIRKCLASRELFAVRFAVVLVDDPLVAAVGVEILPPKVLVKLLGIVVLEECPDLQLQFLFCKKQHLGCSILTVSTVHRESVVLNLFLLRFDLRVFFLVMPATCRRFHNLRAIIELNQKNAAIQGIKIITNTMA